MSTKPGCPWVELAVAFSSQLGLRAPHARDRRAIDRRSAAAYGRSVSNKGGEMTRRKRIATATGLVLAGFALIVPAVLAVPGTSATVRFGNDNVGSSFPPITEHDESGNGKFNLIPRTATIEREAAVTYDILVRFGIHRPRCTRPGRHPTTSSSRDHSRLSTTPPAEWPWEPVGPPRPARPLRAHGRRPLSPNRAATWFCATSHHTLRSSTCTAGLK